LELSVSNLGRGFGRAGHLENVNSLCGWLLITSVGQPIDWLKEDCLIRRNALFVIRKRRQLTT
jgi:hypothetical protein